MQLFLKTQPVAREYFTCIDAMMATMAAHYGRDYELMFLGSWGFAYNPNAENFGLRLGFGIKRFSRETLAQYHGIVSAWSVLKGAPEFLEAARRNLARGAPMGFYLNAYYCPWSQAYRRFSINHYCIVIGIDDEKELTCVDPYSTAEEAYRLPFEELCQETHEIIEFSLEEQPALLPLKTILRENGFCPQDRPRLQKQWEDIRRLARELPEDLDLPHELAAYQEDLKNALIFRQVSNVARHRIKFAVALRYLAARFSQPELEKIAAGLEQARNNWERANNLLYKLHFTKKEEIKLRIGRMLSDTADLEAQTAEKLIRFYEELPTEGKTDESNLRAI